MSTKNTAITVAYGDGIGPEIMEATLPILKEAGARLDIETIEIPGGLPETPTGDAWRCRFMPTGDSGMQPSQTINLLGRIQGAGVDFIKIESLYNFDGQAGYSLGQGQ